MAEAIPGNPTLGDVVAGNEQDRPCIVIEPTPGWVGVDFKELWAYRELLLFFCWRDVAVRYKQTVLGIAWAIVQPLMMMVVFSVVFGRLARLPSEGIPYPLFCFAALLPWQYFQTGTTNAANSMVINAGLITKVYFPRLILPLASVTTPLVDFSIAFIILILLMICFGFAPTWNIVWLPVFMLLLVTTAAGVAFWLSALNVRYRDVRYLVPYLLQVWLYLSPVVYPSSLVPDRFRLIYSLNPVSGAIDGFRWALLGKGSQPDHTIVWSFAVAVALFVGGLFWFKRMENTFADEI